MSACKDCTVALPEEKNDAAGDSFLRAPGGGGRPRPPSLGDPSGGARGRPEARRADRWEMSSNILRFDESVPLALSSCCSDQTFKVLSRSPVAHSHKTNGSASPSRRAHDQRSHNKNAPVAPVPVQIRALLDGALLLNFGPTPTLPD